MVPPLLARGLFYVAVFVPVCLAVECGLTGRLTYAKGGSFTQGWAAQVFHPKPYSATTKYSCGLLERGSPALRRACRGHSHT